MYLYHYFEKARGPFLTISDLTRECAVETFMEIKKINPDLAPPDVDWFLSRRRELENMVRELFIKKGGKPTRNVPHYMTVEVAPSMNTWYIDADCLKINIDEFDVNTISFTYGDMFPIFNPRLDNGEEYRNNVYRFDEITELIDKYGYPQDEEYIPHSPTNPHLLKYVEAHIWSDDIPMKYRNEWLEKHINNEK
ncbi:MAG: hypothetical protein FWD71_03700 [Oscillospiraceae bacterium]|nr:hypothetical protein [Oscillospiraceae bacterium]